MNKSYTTAEKAHLLIIKAMPCIVCEQRAYYAKHKDYFYKKYKARYELNKEIEKQRAKNIEMKTKNCVKKEI